VPLLHLGLPDRFIEHGDPAKLLAMVGLDAAGIERRHPPALRRAGHAARGERLSRPFALAGA
jgi:deoxyxylulose-5-phosphate synthase